MIEITPISKIEVTPHEAIMACFACMHNGKKGWRFPTEYEYINNSELAYNIWDASDVNRPEYSKFTKLYQFVRTVDDNDTNNNE